MSDTPHREGTEDAGPAAPPPSGPPPMPGYAPDAPPPNGRSNGLLLAGIALGLVIAVVMTLVVLLGDDENSSSDKAGSASSSASDGPSATPRDTASATSPSGTAGSTTTRPPTATASPSGGLQSSPVLRAARARGHLIVGTKGDTPGLSSRDPVSGERTGFEIELAAIIARSLGFDPGTTEFREIGSATRETALVNGDVDFYVGTYSITAQRKQTVGFAGPYYVAGVNVLVRTNEPTITGLDDSLAGRNVCTVIGSSPSQVVRSQVPQALSTVRSTYSECVAELLASTVDAVATDDAILRGYAAQRPSELKVVGTPFGVEKYGVGLSRDDTALRAAINDALEQAAADGSWTAAYNKHLDPNRTSSPSPPPVERY